jgi:hypothetical protein
MIADFTSEHFLPNINMKWTSQDKVFFIVFHIDDKSAWLIKLLVK